MNIKTNAVVFITMLVLVFSTAACKQSGEADNISFMSTGGGAFLMLMEGKELPGVVALEA